MCSRSVGSARTTSSPPARTTETHGWRSTALTTVAQKPDSEPPRCRRETSGRRPRLTLSPSLESSAGSTVTEPTTATATTMIVPVANDWNVALPVTYIPAIATITVVPDTSTARPDVAAATSSAASGPRPAARSSRSRRM